MIARSLLALSGTYIISAILISLITLVTASSLGLSQEQAQGFFIPLLLPLIYLFMGWLLVRILRLLGAEVSFRRALLALIVGTITSIALAAFEYYVFWLGGALIILGSLAVTTTLLNWGYDQKEKD
jgi:hypothetical protein